MCVKVEHNMVVSSGIENASGLIECYFLMTPMHESLKDSTEIAAYANKQEWLCDTCYRGLKISHLQ